MKSSVDYGISVDIGTTHITIHLLELYPERLLVESILSNPQSEYGADVISRITHAIRSRENILRLRKLVVSAIRHGVTTILRQMRIDSSSIRQVTMVGNTVMHHLFFDLPLSSLTKPPYAAESKDAILTDASRIGFTNLPNAEVYSPPVVESFIGADAISVMLANGLMESGKNMVSIDIGTNTEIAVKSKRGVYIGSAASGPAFEGMAIECGMPAQEGAICHVEIDETNLTPKLETIGNCRPFGICGTGIISALAAMLDRKIILPTGSFNRALDSSNLSTENNIVYYLLAAGNVTANVRPIVITQPDIRMLQQSKAAIRGVLEVLLEASNLKAEDIEYLYITGLFGTGLVIEDAYRIGMFPRFASAKLQTENNGAIIGADMLHIPRNREKIEQFMKSLKYIEMTDNPTFKEFFVRSISFPD